jgi:hypothetical protein
MDIEQLANELRQLVGTPQLIVKIRKRNGGTKPAMVEGISLDKMGRVSIVIHEAAVGERAFEPDGPTP